MDLSAPLLQLPLDYYRILGVPPQCNDAQVAAAFADRTVQSPRREFSAQLRSRREALLAEAYETLRHPQQRAEYDRALQDPASIGLVVDAEKLAVGLLLLHELGDHQALLDREEEALRLNDSADVRLVLALGLRAVAEEAYRQGNLSGAFRTLSRAVELLRSADLLPAVQQELTAIERRWRPERILQLLAGTPDPADPERQEGMARLAAMLEERGGLEGEGNDGSGLSREEFVQFMQYVRLRLTVAEQQDLFEREANRPSPAAQYLAAQALLARGFARCEPVLVRRARGHLVKLAQRQDVQLELAVCALLLGQVEEALRAIERSQEEQQVAFIRQASGDAPDLLPGLCRYCEEWFAREVFPFCRDLRSAPSRLQTYFAAPEVQAFLDRPPAQSPPPARPSPPPQTAQPARTAAAAPAGGGFGGRFAYPAVVSLVFLVALLLLGSGWLLSRRQAGATRPTPPGTPAPAPVTGTPTPPPPATAIPVPKAAASAPPQSAAPPAPSVQTQVETLLQDWHAAKRLALGPDHRSDELATFLSGAALGLWRERVAQARTTREHWQFRLKTLQVEQIEQRTASTLVVTAHIDEVANFYKNRERQSGRSYDRPYRVRYLLVREQGNWRIGEMKVL